MAHSERTCNMTTYCPTRSALELATSAPAAVTANADEPTGPPVSESNTAFTFTVKLNAELSSTATIAGLTGIVTWLCAFREERFGLEKLRLMFEVLFMRGTEINVLLRGAERSHENQKYEYRNTYNAKETMEWSSK